jgi:uncharacterized YigZ family protein
MDNYTTIKESAQAEYVERRSRFIGAIAPVSTQEEAIAFIGQKRIEHREASHNVYAYILRDPQTRRCSDDGEPQGTAGIPTLDVLQKSDLIDVVLVVTRYFGGVLLGTGGLARAYSRAARLSVEAASIVPMQACVELALTLAYEQYGKVSYMLPKYAAQTTFLDFGVDVKLWILIKESDLGFVQKELTDARIGMKIIGRRFAQLGEAP